MCAQPPVIETEGTIYKGTFLRNNTVATFYGVPYAEPPVGDRRFRAPVPIKRRHGPGKTVVDASKEPNFCIQSLYGPTATVHGGAGSEDCLHLNIYVPPRVLRSRPSSAKLPTLVYIHGGAFKAGNPLAWPFDHWVEQFPDVVVVSVYYRLGIFGFLSAPNAKGALDYNAGFLDQLAALKWVKENIANFGGDPQKITINGQSAGGLSMELHLVANGGKQTLFQQVIGQSMWRIPLMQISETQAPFDFIMGEAGCNIAGYSNVQKIDCYRGKDIPTLMRSSENAMIKNSSWTPYPVIDGTILPGRPTQLINQGKFSKVPVLVGATTDENFFFTSSLQTDFNMWWPAMTNLSAIQQVYPSSDFANETIRAQTANGETMFRCPREHVAEAQTAAGKSAYAYRFDSMNPTQQGPPLVGHSAENWWMFRGVNTVENGTYAFTPFNSTSQSTFAKELLAYWVSFVRSGDPNVHRLEGSPIWPKWENGYVGGSSASPKGKRMVLKEGSTTGYRGKYQSGSRAEQEPAKELSRCHAVDALAPNLHI